MAEKTAALSAAEELNEAKKRFRESINGYDVLSTIKDHPFISIGCSFLAGFGLMRTKLDLQNLAILPLILQLGNSIVKYSLNQKR